MSNVGITINEDGSHASNNQANDPKIEVLVAAKSYEIAKVDTRTNNFHSSMDSVIDRLHQLEKMAVLDGNINAAITCVGMEAKLRGLTSARAEGWMNSKSSYANVVSVSSPRLPEHEGDSRFGAQVIGSEEKMVLVKQELEANT